MMKHKWHKEIKAWADGAEIEALKAGIWFTTDYPAWDGGEYQFRIKPQPKQPKYLYVILQPDDSILLRTQPVLCGEEEYFGKIEVNDG